MLDRITAPFRAKGKRGIAAFLCLGALLGAGLSACSSDADVASRNISQAAEQFEVNRRIVFINGITDEYLLEIEGRCSVETDDSYLGGALEVTCKVADGTGPDSFKKHWLLRSDNAIAVIEQLEPIEVSVYHYRVIFKPSVVIPDVDAEVDQIPGLDGN